MKNVINLTNNIVDFTAEKNKRCGTTAQPSLQMFELVVHMDNNGQYEVFMEIDDTFDSGEIADALAAATMKYVLDHNLVEEDEDELGACQSCGGPAKDDFCGFCLNEE